MSAIEDYSENNLEKQKTLPEGQLPFDIVTILLGLWRRRYIFLAAFIISLAGGVCGGIFLGKRSYEAETIMLFKPEVSKKVGIDGTPSLSTQKNMVKIKANLEEVRKRLNLSASLESLSSAIKIHIQRNADLVIFRVSRNSPEEAANIVNELREVFFENQIRIRRKDAAKKIEDIRKRLEKVNDQLKIANDALRKFTTENKIVDFKKEIEGYLDKQHSLKRLYEESEIEKRSADLQVNNLDRIINDLKQKVEKEKVAMGAVENVSVAKLRIAELKEAIEEDKSHRANLSELNQKEIELQRAEELKEKGLISEQEYDAAKTAYQKQKVVTLETEQTKKWKEEVEELEKKVRNSSLVNSATASALLLNEMTLQSFNMKMKQVTLKDKVKNIGGSLKKIKKKLNTLPELKRRYIALSREVDSKNIEKQNLENKLVQANRIYNTKTSDFNIVTEAKPPSTPSKSSRKLIAIAIFVGGCFMGFIFILVLELLDTKIRSAAEFSAKFSMPTLGVIPSIASKSLLTPKESDSAIIESMRITAHKIKRLVSKEGGRVLIVSAQHGEGKTVFITNLAACLGRYDEKVLVADTQIRSDKKENALGNLIPPNNAGLKGLGEYLSFETDEMSEIISPTALPGVECLPRISKASPDSLGSKRMAGLLDKLSDRFSLTLLEASPVLPYVDAELLAQWCDAIILVVKAGGPSYFDLKETIARLEVSGAPIIGAILNSVVKPYIDKKYRINESPNNI